MRTSDVFIAIVGNELFGIPLDLPQGVVINEAALFAVAKKHALSHLLIGPIERNDITIKDERLLEQMMKAAKTAIRKEAVMKHVFEEIKEIFVSNGIDYAPLKGIRIKSLYPDGWMRSSCDLDILIKESDLERATAALVAAGFETDNVKNYHDVSFYYHNVNLELHFSVKENIEKFDKVLAEADKHLVNVGDHEYAEDNEFFIYHVVAHTAYHFLSGGCGVRSICDLKFLLEKTTFDKDKLDAMLLRGGLKVFFERLKDLCGVWFGNEDTNETVEEMKRFIIMGGAFGSGKNSVSMHLAREKKGKLGYILKLTFLPYDNMCELYPSLRGKKLLLPFYYVFRIFSKLFLKSGKSARKRAKTVVATDRTAHSSLEGLLKQLGLEDN